MELTDLDRARIDVGKLVSALARRSAFEHLIASRNAEGALAVVPVVEEDSLHFAVKMVRRAGGNASLVAIGHDDEDKSIRLGIARVTIHVHEGGGERWDLPVGPRCTVGDLFRFLPSGSSATIRLANEDAMEITDVLEGPLPEVADGELV